MKNPSTPDKPAGDASARTPESCQLRYEQHNVKADAAHARRQRERQTNIDRLQAEMRSWSLRELFEARKNAS
jgi:hypothetical protein